MTSEVGITGMTDRERCAKSTGVARTSFTEWDLRCWLAFGESEKPPDHQWYSPPLMASQSVCRVCRDTMRCGTSCGDLPYTDRWCWKPVREKYEKAKKSLVSRAQIQRMLKRDLITQDQVQPLLEAKWGL